MEGVRRDGGKHRAVEREERPDVVSRRQERELFFWTVREAAKVLLLVAVVLRAVVYLVVGGPFIPEFLLRLL